MLPKLLSRWLDLGRVEASKGIVLCFLTGFMVRLIPELLAYPYPVGFDTVYYASRMKSGIIWNHWTQFFTSTWLLYAFIIPIYNFSHIDPFLILKIVTPVLYGLNVAGIYFFAKEVLGWNTTKSLMAGCFFSVQLASLRISWDLLRNILGMAILLLALTLTTRISTKRGLACFILLSLLTVFSHELAAVTLLIVVLGSIFWRLTKEQTKMSDKRTFFGVLPALIVFLAGIYFRLFPIPYKIETNVISAKDVNVGNVGVFFLVNYLDVKTSVDYYTSYFDLALNVLTLFCVLYLPYLFLVLKGFFRHRILDFWTCLLTVGSFGCLILPFCALLLWHRWMFMLVYTFTFYAVNGLDKLLKKRNSGSFAVKLKNSERKVKGMLLLTVLLGCVYLATPVLMSTFNVGISSIPYVCRYFSVSPTVPYQDVGAVINAMEWLDKNMEDNSCVILHHAFFFWGSAYLNNSHIIVHFTNNITAALNICFVNDFSPIYFVWWNQDIGWYGFTPPDYFSPVENFGRISIFKYMG